jgi:hypothetical protein
VFMAGLTFIPNGGGAAVPPPRSEFRARKLKGSIMTTQLPQQTGAVSIGYTALRATHAADSVAARLAELEAVCERMRKVNSLVRHRHAKGLKKLGYADAQISRLLQSNSEKHGSFYPDSKMRNNYQQIVTLRQLVRMLDNAGRQDVAIEEEAYSFSEDVAAQQIRFQFRVKPDKATRALLRRAGFQLRPSRNTYERHLDETGVAAAAALRAHLNRVMY